MRNIEPGCMAIIYGSIRNNGSVTVSNYIGYVFGFESDLWGVDRDIIYSAGSIKRFIPEKYLMRIDGYVPEEEDETVYQDKRVTVRD